MFQIEQINLSSWLYFLEILICIMEEDMQFVKLDVFFYVLWKKTCNRLSFLKLRMPYFKRPRQGQMQDHLNLVQRKQEEILQNFH